MKKATVASQKAIRPLPLGTPVIKDSRAAKILSVHRNTVRNWINDGTLASRAVATDARGVVRKTSESEALRVAREMNLGT